MRKSYDDLFDLMSDDSLARRYFENLPDALRADLARRSGSVNSMERLKRCAEELAARRRR